jgi:hypothetical protein
MRRQLGQDLPPTGMRWQGLHNGVTREFGVTLQLDGVVVTAHAQKITLYPFQGQIGMPWQKPQMRQLLLSRDPLIEHRHVKNQRRQAHPG